MASLVQGCNWYFLQGCTGISFQEMNLVSACIWNEKYFKHSSQLRIKFSCWSFKPGQYTVSLALSSHLPTLKCPSCICWNVGWCFLCGIKMQVPFQTIPSSTVSSSLKVQYGWIPLSASLMVLCHPWVMVSWVRKAHHLLGLQFLYHLSCHF